jgi:hypothetical protein
MDLLYHFLMNPTKTIQLFTHYKDWRLWWVILGIQSLISMIKLSSLGMLVMASQLILGAASLLIMTVIIDSAAQLILRKTQFWSVLYWLGFSKTVLWLSPSLVVIQNASYSLGAVAMFFLHFIFFIYLWTTLKKTYSIGHFQVVLLIISPVIYTIMISLSAVVYLAMVVQ